MLDGADDGVLDGADCGVRVDSLGPAADGSRERVLAVLHTNMHEMQLNMHDL